MAFLLTLALAGKTINMRWTGDAEYNAPAFGYTTCSYQGVDYGSTDLRVRVVVEGVSCPYTIKYDPATGTWSR